MNPVDIIDTIVHQTLDWILGLRGTIVYVAVWMMAFVETALFVGFVLPGETAMAIAGALAARTSANIVVMLLVGFVGAVAGDSVSYWLGRRYGRKLVFRWEWVRVRLEPRLRRSNAFFQRHGGAAIFLGRWVATMRSVVPFSAGISRMPFRQFLFWNVITSAAWVSTVMLLGYTVGNVFIEALRKYSTPIVLGATGLLILVYLVRRATTAGGQGDEETEEELSSATPTGR